MKTLQARTIVFPGAQRTLHKISMAIVVSLMVVFHSTVDTSTEVPDGSLIFRYEDDIYMDFLLNPAHYSDGDAVYFEVKEGAGIGFWENQSTGQAGKGATVGRYFTVGEDIPIDAIIRLIPGSAGRPDTAIPISAGGSGSGGKSGRGGNAYFTSGPDC